MKTRNGLVLLALALPALVMVGGWRIDRGHPGSRSLSPVSWWAGEAVAASESEREGCQEDEGKCECGHEPCEEGGGKSGADSGGGSSGFLLHGDTSTPDEVLIKLYGDKIPAERFLMALCRKMPPVKFNHRKHVEMKIARCGNCHHKEPKEIKPCAKCHVYAPEKKEDVKYMKAHHDLCQRCHKAKKKGQEGSPVKCNECHRPENTAASGSNCPLPKESGK